MYVCMYVCIYIYICICIYIYVTKASRTSWLVAVCVVVRIGGQGGQVATLSCFPELGGVEGDR
jgi:hypothetical protein